MKNTVSIEGIRNVGSTFSTEVRHFQRIGLVRNGLVRETRLIRRVACLQVTSERENIFELMNSEREGMKDPMILYDLNSSCKGFV